MNNHKKNFKLLVKSFFIVCLFFQVFSTVNAAAVKEQSSQEKPQRSPEPPDFD